MQTEYRTNGVFQIQKEWSAVSHLLLSSCSCRCSALLLELSTSPSAWPSFPLKSSTSCLPQSLPKQSPQMTLHQHPGPPASVTTTDKHDSKGRAEICWYLDNQYAVSFDLVGQTGMPGIKFSF